MTHFFECTRILDWQQRENKVELRCQLGTHGVATLHLEPVADGILRIEIRPDVVDQRSDVHCIPKEPVDVPPWGTEASDSAIEVTFGSDMNDKVHIGFDPFSFAISRRGDTTPRITSTNDDYTTWNVPLTRPWGAESSIVGQNMFEDITGVNASFLMRFDERFYGLGEQFRTFNHRGERFKLTNVNGQGTRAQAYKNVPFFMSNYGYGVLVDTYRPATVDLGHTSNRSISVSVPDRTLVLYVFIGDTPKEILRLYTRLTGRPAKVPLWSLGLWISTYFIETDADRVRRQTEEYRRRGIPVDVYHLDCFWLRDNYWNDFTWNTEKFPEPKALLKDLHTAGYRVSLWENPYISVFSNLYREAEQKGYLLRNPDGETYRAQTWREDLMPVTGIVDFSNPEAVRWWQDIHRRLVADGVDVFKTDFGEAIPIDSVAFDGTTGDEMHNRYAHLYNQTVFEATKEQTGDQIVWARTAWAGTQRFPTHWGGDPHCTWEDMASSLKGGLSFSMSGFGYWSHDIGGFKGVPTAELYARWAQFGLLSPHARIHGWSDRDPWVFGEEIAEIVRRYSRFRYSILPYLQHLSVIASREGIPVMRPLYLEFPDDPIASEIDTEYMLGDAVLVAPVLAPGGAVSFYLPQGTWMDLMTGEIHTGGRYYRRTCELAKMPLFLKAGKPLLRTSVRQHVGNAIEDRKKKTKPINSDPRGGATTADSSLTSSFDDLIMEIVPLVDSTQTYQLSGRPHENSDNPKNPHESSEASSLTVTVETDHSGNVNIDYNHRQSSPTNVSLLLHGNVSNVTVQNQPVSMLPANSDIQRDYELWTSGIHCVLPEE